MNVLPLLSPELSTSLCVTLLHSLWQVAVLAALAWLASRLGRQRSVERAYAAHVAAFLLSFVCLAITFLCNAEPKTSADAAAMANNPPPAVGEQPIDSAAFLNSTERVVEETTAVAPPSNALGVRQPLRDSVPRQDISRSTLTWRRAAPWLAGLYAVGVSLMLLRLAWSIARAERLRRRSRTATEGPLVDALRRLSEAWSLRVAPALATAENIVVPKVVGLAKPTILMPASALTGLSPSELEMILAHELAHVRRYDLWVNLVQRLAEAALFFNPALWLLSRRISTLREYCCDELACGASQQRGAPSHIRYAQALLRVVELGEKAPCDRSTVAALAASGRSPSELRRRVARLFGEPLREPLQVSRGGLIASLVLLSLLCSSALWSAQTDSDRAETQAPKPRTEADRELETKVPESDAPAMISGKIVLEDGSLAEAKGWLYSDSTTQVGEHSANSTASTEGQFTDSFSCEVPAGTVRLSYFPEGFAPAWAGPFELQPGQVLDDVTITLNRGFSVGLILQDDEGKRVPGATVAAHPVTDEGIHGPVREQQTDDRGELLLEHLADKKYQLTITAPGYQPLRTAPLRVEAGETLRPTMVRSSPAQGVVRFADGTPAPNTKLRVIREWRKNGESLAYGNEGEGFWGKVLTTCDGRGRFQLDQLGDGSQYVFVVDAVDGARAVVDDLHAGQQEVQIVLPRRHDLVVYVKGDLEELPQRRGKPFVSVRQPIKIVRPDGSTFGELIGADATLEPTEDGGRAIFRGLAVDLRKDAPAQTVQVTLGYDHQTRRTVDVNLDGTTIVEFSLNELAADDEDAASQAPTSADQAVAEARARTFGLQGAERIAFKQIYRQTDRLDMPDDAGDDLPSLWKARASQVADAELDRNRHDTVLAWDADRLLLESFSRFQPQNAWRQTHYWDGRQGWIGESSSRPQGESKNVYRYGSLDELTEHIAPFYYPHWAAAGGRLPWPGQVALVSEHGVDPALTRYRLVGAETIDGVLCDVYDGPERHEKVWIERAAKRVKAVSRHYVSDFSMEDNLKALSQAAGRRFDDRLAYEQWYEKQSADWKSVLHASWSAATWKSARPGNLTVFSDYRKVAPGVLWPHQVDRVTVHPKGRGDDGFRHYLAKIVVEQMRDFDLDELAANALPEPGVKVTDRTGEAPFDYVWTDELDQAEIERLRQEKLAETRAEEEETRRINATPINSVNDAIQILTEGPATDPTQVWARAIRYLSDHPTEALPALIETLDGERRDHPISKLAFALRALDDARAVPALIRALPRTLQPGRSDYGLLLDDDELLSFMQQHDQDDQGGKLFTYGRAFREVVGALRRLTGRQSNEMELNWISLEGTEVQRRLARQQFEQVASEWAAWWEANWQTHVDDEAYATVNLTDVLGPKPASAGAMRPPSGPNVELIELSSGGVIRSVHETDDQCFFDLDTQRQAGWPEELPPLGKTRLDSPELLAWARREGFDVLGVTYTPEGEKSPLYCLKPFDLAAWQITETEHRQVEDMARGNLPYDLSRPVELIVPRRTIPKPWDPKHGGDAFLFVTGEGTAGVLRLTAQVTKIEDHTGRRSSSNHLFERSGFFKGVKYALTTMSEPAVSESLAKPAERGESPNSSGTSRD